MADPNEEELLAMLSDPTADKVRRDQIRADILMRDVGRAIAPQVNEILAKLAKQMAADQEPLGPDFEKVWDESTDKLFES